MKSISICMITYNKLPFLKRSLAAIADSVVGDWDVEIIVLDNGSTDGTSQHLEIFAHICPVNIKYTHVREERNVGLNGYGLIVPMATGDIIVTADDDVFEVAPPGWEERFRRVLYSTFGGRRFGYVSTDTLNEDGGRLSGGALGIARIDDLEIEVGIAGGWFAATTRDVVDCVGGFHLGMPRMHLEDADFQGRVWNSGYLVGTLLNTKVFHARAPSYYTELGCENTYHEKEKWAMEVGISIERI